jgi:hypothetical protein
MKWRWVIVPIALAALGAMDARAGTEEDLRDIRKQIHELKANYEARIRALEEKLKEAEGRAAAPAPVIAPAPLVAAPAPMAAPTSASAFNPAISAILQGRYANLSKESSASGPRGFSLSESEVTLSANVDQKFAGVLTFALTPDDTVEVEEAYGTMIAPLHGVTPKFGRFLSGIGYLNEQHAHVWDFVDAPLAYDAFLRGQFRNDGVQVKWLAPTEHYIELGAEAGSGKSFSGTDADRNGAGVGAIYAHTGGDVGLSHNWRAGASYLRARGDRGAPDTSLAIGDFVWKWAPNGNSRETSFKLQGEYFAQSTGALKPKGAYVQAVYQFMPEWRIGARYDRIDPEGYDPKRASVMIDWSPSEFSRVRLQFARARLQPDFTDNQVFLQYVLSLGAHGAHRY